MKASNSFKQSLLKHMLVGLHVGGASSETLLERKRDIKLSADVAIAATRGPVNWSRALITDLSKQENNKDVVRKILGDLQFERMTLKQSHYTKKVLKSKKISRRSFRRVHGRRAEKHIDIAQQNRSLPASGVARRMVKTRTQVLKRLVPGGESLNDISLLGEALDYIICLQAQVDVMRRLANAADFLSCSTSTSS